MNLIILTVTIAILLYLYYMFNTKENLTNISKNDQNIVDSVFNYINNNRNVTFQDYIYYLSSIKNTNLNLIDRDVFSGFKLLKKKNMLTKQDIINEMKI